MDPIAEPRILFLADGGPEVGGGHVMRCLTLAGALAQRGARCGFVDHPGARPILEAFAGPELERLPVQELGADAIAAQAAGLAGAWDTVVVDHYRLSAPHEERLREGGQAVVVIDDLADRPHGCDL